MSAPAAPRPEARHHADRGATNAECGETVTASHQATWDSAIADFTTTRFTAHRELVTCGECTYRLNLRLGRPPSHVFSDAELAAHDAQVALDAVAALVDRVEAFADDDTLNAIYPRAARPGQHLSPDRWAVVLPAVIGLLADDLEEMRVQGFAVGTTVVGRVRAIARQAAAALPVVTAARAAVSVAAVRTALEDQASRCALAGCTPEQTLRHQAELIAAGATSTAEA